jgi:geranylgeranyl pyrophosphate synthase
VAAQLGVLAAGYGVDTPEMQAAGGYAERIGLASQVMDDVLDVTSTPEVMGKSVGGDADHRKNTFLSFKTVPEAQVFAAKLTEEAVALLTPYDGRERLVALARFLAVREN